MAKKKHQEALDNFCTCYCTKASTCNHVSGCSNRVILQVAIDDAEEYENMLDTTLNNYRRLLDGKKDDIL